MPEPPRLPAERRVRMGGDTGASALPPGRRRLDRQGQAAALAAMHGFGALGGRLHCDMADGARLRRRRLGILAHGPVMPNREASANPDVCGGRGTGRLPERVRDSSDQPSRRAFSKHGKNRLVMPAFAPAAVQEPASEEKRGGGGGSGDGGPPSGVDPIIQGLLARLPKSGEVWPEADRDLWLDLLKGSFKLIYKDRPSIPSPPVPRRPEIPGQ